MQPHDDLTRGSNRPPEGMMTERLIFWSLNGVNQAPILCSGTDAEALLRGHLLTAGMVRGADAITGVTCSGGLWQVRAETLPDPGHPLARLETLAPNASPRMIRMAELCALQDRVMALDHAAGLHAVLLSDGEQTVIGQDIGRHNALDIAVGKAVMAGLRLDRAALCSSGRLSLEMFAKAALTGIPILATRKQVGSLCAAYGARLDIAVCRVGQGTGRWFSAGWREMNNE